MPNWDNSDVGGLIASDVGSVSNSYSTGKPTDHYRDGYVGGFFGYDLGEQGTLADCYWDTTTSGTDEATGDGSTTGITGLTTQELQSGLPDGFDPTIWAEKKGIIDGLPYLIANPPAKK